MKLTCGDTNNLSTEAHFETTWCRTVESAFQWWHGPFGRACTQRRIVDRVQHALHWKARSTVRLQSRRLQSSAVQLFLIMKNRHKLISRGRAFSPIPQHMRFRISVSAYRRLSNINGLLSAAAQCSCLNSAGLNLGRHRQNHPRRGRCGIGNGVGVIVPGESTDSLAWLKTRTSPSWAQFLVAAPQRVN